MLGNIIILIGYSHQQIDWWCKKIFSYEESKNINIVYASSTYSIQGMLGPGWYCMVGEYFKNPNHLEIEQLAKSRLFKELILETEEPHALQL